MLKPGHRNWKTEEKIKIYFDDDNYPKYRYVFECIWNNKRKVATFILLNPSIADYKVCDPTLNRSIEFARHWGFGGIIVLNLFAYITPNPHELLSVKDPIGSKNDEMIDLIAPTSDVIVFAWGDDYGYLLKRDNNIIERLKEYNPQCILKSKKGNPRHPLYLKSKLPLVPFL